MSLGHMVPLSTATFRFFMVAFSMSAMHDNTFFSRSQLFVAWLWLCSYFLAHPAVASGLMHGLLSPHSPGYWFWRLMFFYPNLEWQARDNTVFKRAL